ncbi:hypothetical protein V490_05673, partial [Pseudogymnoascus sp. VKM F-3557]
MHVPQKPVYERRNPLIGQTLEFPMPDHEGIALVVIALAEDGVDE